MRNTGRSMYSRRYTRKSRYRQTEREVAGQGTILKDLNRRRRGTGKSKYRRGILASKGTIL